MNISSDLSESILNLTLYWNIRSVERHVMVSLDNVKDGHHISTVKECFNDMTTKETTTHDDNVGILICTHEYVEEDPGLTSRAISHLLKQL